MIYHWKGITLAYTTCRLDLVFDSVLIIQTDKEFTTMKYGYLGGMQLVPFVEWSYKLKMRKMIAH
jgi:hypothetical protein